MATYRIIRDGRRIDGWDIERSSPGERLRTVGSFDNKKDAEAEAARLNTAEQASNTKPTGSQA